MAENTKMDVDGDASETVDEHETEENMDEGAGEESDSSDSEDSDGNEAVHDPKVQQLELQVLLRFCDHFSPRVLAHMHENSCQKLINVSQAMVAVIFYNASFFRDIGTVLFCNCLGYSTLYFNLTYIVCSIQQDQN